ncbi:MAG TPA: VOC family protein [Terriglobales bacterium]|nr:VOC family protein [Terriglobales bacterium]
MPPKVGYSTPLLHVAEIERSIRFYGLLGFVTVDTDRCDPLGWARVHCEGGAVMFLRAEEEVDPSAQAVFLYMYTPDLAGLREHLLAIGVRVPPIKHPPYMPSGEITIADPDGYTIFVGHWGASEQEAWEKRIGAKT